MSLQIQVTADVASAGKQIEDFSKKSRTALNSLSLVAQDLPFGFIGIQNNLPGVISSFGELTREAGGVGGALKQISTALVGPAGLFLAFSVVTSAITFAIQKYGSLGAAFDALVGKINLATKAQQDFNKAVAEATGNSATEVAEIRILVAVLTDLSKPLKERQSAYVELQKIRPDVIAGQKLENISTEKATKLINENANAILNLILLKAKEAAISSVLNKNAEDLAKLLIEENDLKNRIAKSEKDYADSRKNSNDFDELSARLIEGLTKKLNNNKKEQEALNKVAEDYIKILDPTIKGISEIDRRTKELTDSIKKQKNANKELSDSQKFAEKSALSFYKFNGRDITEQEAFSSFVVGTTNLQVKAIDRLIKQRVKLRKETSKEASAALVPTTISGQVNPFINQKFLDTQAIAAELAIAQQLIDSVFFNPIAESFENFINTGKFSFEEFAKTVKANIAKIVAQIAASKIVELLGAIYAGPIGGAVGGGAGGKIGSLLSALSGFLPTFTQNPNFGGIQGNNALGMSGSVNLVLRGTDLVGSINRTNSQISRVG